VSEKRVIVNADDFGMSTSVTDAILVAHRYGFLTSASLMVNMPAAEYAVQQAARAPKLGIGVHLNICEGKPILPASQVRSLVDAAGNFHRPQEMIRKLWRWQVAGHEIEAEFRAQIQWMRRRGHHPTHADSHHHMHIYPAAVRPFFKTVTAERISCARASRFSYWPKQRLNEKTIGGPHEGSLVRRLAVQAYRSALQRTLPVNVKSPDSRISFLARDRHDPDSLGARWAATFENLPPGTYELSCHPGLFDPTFSHADRIHVQREAELHCLTDHALRDVLNRSGIRLISYNDLASTGRTHTAAVRAATS
jgi:chitin disaccharide deacetylase